jgi:hypothetical protein
MRALTEQLTIEHAATGTTVAMEVPIRP